MELICDISMCQNLYILSGFINEKEVIQEKK